MQDQNREIYFVIIIGILLGLLLVGFIVRMLFLYQRRQHQQEQDLARVKDMYEREALRSELEIQENTFKTISQELHDNIGQMLSVVKLSLSVMPVEKEHPAYEQLSHAQQILNKAIYDLSDLTKSLYTDRISDVGLAESIRFELVRLKNTGLLKVHFTLTGIEFPLPERKAIFLFRIFQEILNNILKHSKATHVNVLLTYIEEKLLELEISDNGEGFDVDAKRKGTSASQGVGLKSIFNRAQLIGASIVMNSEMGSGTTVYIKIPNE